MPACNIRARRAIEALDLRPVHLGTSMPCEQVADSENLGGAALHDLIADRDHTVARVQVDPLDFSMPASCASHRSRNRDSPPAVLPERREAGYMIIRALSTIFVSARALCSIARATRATTSLATRAI